MNKTIIVSAPAFGDAMGELMGLPSWDAKLEELQYIYETHGIKPDTIAYKAFYTLAEGRKVFTESQALIDLIKEVLGEKYNVFTIDSK
ncbi:hypothetical protein [Bacillus sp. SN10]|uniref:hypothetical protein n=1 Tax=Bacillus sp. SN10 TaxID=2056493 RepID=UPI000C33BEE7|nr:hypothetical protein [Bacillus sp. SN10]PKJ52647.1 hypothetical protein CWE34_26355 [Bacillus sp. SN10]